MFRITTPSMNRLLLIAFIAACWWGLTSGASGSEPAPFMMRATVAGRLVEGQPLAWNDRQMLLLGRDGVLHEFDPAAAADAKKVGTGFAAYSTAEMQAQLGEEFGRSFETTATAHFVVVHSRGSTRDWADRLESLYRSFTHYVSVRGFQVKPPVVPLVAVVFRNQHDYYAYAAAGGLALQAGTMGHYDPATNRVFMYDLGPENNNGNWAANAATIIHEATHQTAYNVGVHRRFAEQPRWVVEGLAMMFEARGVWDATSIRPQSDRINRERLEYFRRTSSQRPADWLVRLAASDAPFHTSPLTAYAEAWTLTFYLCETRPQEYCSFLARVAARETFAQYTPLERMGDFTEAFGGDLPLLAAQLERFVAELP